MSSFENTLSRMKDLYTYGKELNESSKSNAYTLEHSAMAADGKTYGIIRECNKYYIKSAPKGKETIAEAYEYIGGICNKKNYEYSSYNNALKNFELKLASINEACDGKVNISTLDPFKKGDFIVEGTEKMKDEIARQRQIMFNVSMLMNEGTEIGAGRNNDVVKFDGKQPEAETGKKGDECVADKKADAKPEYAGSKTNGVDKKVAPFNNNTTKCEDQLKEECECGSESCDCEKYCDGAKGLPSTPGVGEADSDHNNQPFNKAVNEEEDMEFADDVEGDDDVEGEDDFDLGTEDDMDFNAEDGEGLEGEDDMDFDAEGEDDFDAEGEDDFDAEGEDDFDAEGGDDDIMAQIEELQAQIDALKAQIEGGDEELDAEDDTDFDAEGEDDFGAEGDDFDDEESLDAELDAEDEDDFDTEDEDDFDAEDEDDFDETGNIEEGGFFHNPEYEDDEQLEDLPDEVSINEAKRRKMDSIVESVVNSILNEDEIHAWGKHPGYQKKPMELPSTGQDKNQWGEDWNDETVYSEQPFGTKIGDGVPFEKMVNAITKDVVNKLSEAINGGKKKSKVSENFENERKVLKLNKNEVPPQEQPQAAPMDGASTVPSGDPMTGGGPMADGQPPVDEQPPIDGQGPAVGGDQMTDDTAMDGDPMGGGQPPVDGGEGDDSTMSIINQLSDEDREAVRAYAESMLSRSEGEQEEPAGEGPMMDDPSMGGEQQPMMESFIFTKKQLNTLMENFGPTEDELQKQDERKPLPKKKEKTVSSKSPFNSPKFK